MSERGVLSGVFWDQVVSKGQRMFSSPSWAGWIAGVAVFTCSSLLSLFSRNQKKSKLSKFP